MSADLEPVDDVPEDEPEVDLDLDLLDNALKRESVGEPTTIRIDGTVVHIAHANDWSSSAMRAATVGDWDAWARAVIVDDDEFQAWADADLHNYQTEAVFAECGRQARLNAGKSAKLSGSHRHTRKR